MRTAVRAAEGIFYAVVAASLVDALVQITKRRRSGRSIVSGVRTPS